MISLFNAYIEVTCCFPSQLLDRVQTESTTDLENYPKRLQYWQGLEVFFFFSFAVTQKQKIAAGSPPSLFWITRNNYQCSLPVSEIRTHRHRPGVLFERKRITHTHTHTHTPVSYTHLTLPTMSPV